jgi:Recombination endonuclease VII
MALYDSQGGKCAVCRHDIPPTTHRSHIDHCHDTGKVRGILCLNCNTGIGRFKESEAVMLAAIAYLRRARGDA